MPLRDRSVEDSATDLLHLRRPADRDAQVAGQLGVADGAAARRGRAAGRPTGSTQRSGSRLKLLSGSRSRTRRRSRSTTDPPRAVERADRRDDLRRRPARRRPRSGSAWHRCVQGSRTAPRSRSSPARRRKDTTSSQGSPAATVELDGSGRLLAHLDPTGSRPRPRSRGSRASATRRLLPPPSSRTGIESRSAPSTASTSSASVCTTTQSVAGPPTRSVVCSASVGAHRHGATLGEADDRLGLPQDRDVLARDGQRHRPPSSRRLAR